MRLACRRVRLLLLLPTAGVLFSGGCVASIGQALNIVLSPEAPENALVAPYTRVAPLAELVAQLLR
jgi:hypothetical protein